MWIAKKPFLKYAKGDEVTEGDAKKYGSLYCTKSSDISSALAGNINTDTTPEQNDATANNTNETPAADPETAGEVITEPETPEEPEAPAETTEPEKPKAKKRR